MHKGIRPAHIGLILGDRTIAPPSQFALATFGVMSRSEIKETLEELVEGIKIGAISTDDTPMLDYYVKTEALNMQTLGLLARRGHGTHKLISQEAILKAEYKDQEATHSKNDVFVLEVESRSPRTEPKPKRQKKRRRFVPHNDPRKVIIYSPFDARKIDFRGGTPYPDFNLEKGHHWSAGQENERSYLESLQEHERAQFEKRFEIVDYARAAGLIELNKIILKGDFHLIGGSGDLQGRIPLLPFDFSLIHSTDLEERYSRMKYAFEILLKRYSTPKTVRVASGHETGRITMNDLDEIVFGKTGFIGNEVRDAYRSGDITKGVILNRKNFGEYNWAVIQAIEEHYFSQGREFKGYSLEFVNKPGFRTTSIVFDLPEESEEDFQMRIVLSNKFVMPYILYVKPNPTEKDLKYVKKMDEDPTKMVNLPADKTRWKRGWIDADWRTGQKECLFTLFEPNDSILQRADEISKRMAYGINASTLRDRYVGVMKGR
ncbi:hypothetical protein HQ533_00845 [Candidatus Woesearchaeota archaeon]|nr:hypothetical protein [Candidatus Woesearchaeota archaeon]